MQELYKPGEIPRALSHSISKGSQPDTYIDAWAAVEQLPEVDKVVVKLRAWGFTWAEVALLIGVNGKQEAQGIYRRAMKGVVMKCWLVR